MKKRAGMRPMPTYVITMTIKNDDIPRSPGLWGERGMVQDLYPHLPTPSTLSSTFNK